MCLTLESLDIWPCGQAPSTNFFGKMYNLYMYATPGNAVTLRSPLETFFESFKGKKKHLSSIFSTLFTLAVSRLRPKLPARIFNSSRVGHRIQAYVLAAEHIGLTHLGQRLKAYS